MKYIFSFPNMYVVRLHDADVCIPIETFPHRFEGKDTPTCVFFEPPFALLFCSNEGTLQHYILLSN